MSSTEVHSPSRGAAVGTVDMKLEVQIIPVSDVDRSKEFYQRLGWRLDDDVAPLDGLACRPLRGIGHLRRGITSAAPGSAGRLIVPDIVAAHDELAGRGIEVSEIWHGPPFPPGHGSPVPTPSAPATGRSAPSPIPTAIRGWCRRSRRGCPAASTPLEPHSRPRRT